MMVSVVIPKKNEAQSLLEVLQVCGGLRRASLGIKAIVDNCVGVEEFRNICSEDLNIVFLNGEAVGNAGNHYRKESLPPHLEPQVFQDLPPHRNGLEMRCPM
jgi:hypothetical protein